MQIDFHRSAFNDHAIEDVLDFAQAWGFDVVEIDVGGHIKSLDKVGSVAAAARDRGLIVSFDRAQQAPRSMGSALNGSFFFLLNRGRS